MDRSLRELRTHTLQQKTYIPVPSQRRATRYDAPTSLLIATRTGPKQVCGWARRIGYREELALYRLKVRYGPDKGNVLTLPDLFILDSGVFQSISEWWAYWLCVRPLCRKRS